VYTSVVPVSRFRYECRNAFPARSNIVPHGVVLTGKVENIKQDNDGNDNSYMASVLVGRVFYGPRNLRKTRVTISGFGANKDWCHNNVEPGDSWIFVLQPITYPDYFRLNSSLIKITLNNLEKMDGIIADEPYRKLTTVTDCTYHHQLLLFIPIFCFSALREEVLPQQRNLCRGQIQS